MILEGIVTTRNDDGTTNVAPMGPTFDEYRPKTIVLRPFRTARTYENLRRRPEGVFHVTDDVLLLAEATLGMARPALVPASEVGVDRLADCCRFAEFTVEEVDDAAERARIECRVKRWGRVREFFGLNRAKFAVVEAAILASRVHLLDPLAIEAQWKGLSVLVDKTGGDEEHRAFALLTEYITKKSDQRG